MGLLLQDPTPLQPLLACGAFVLRAAHFAVGVRVVHALVEEGVVTVVVKLRSIEHGLLFALRMLEGRSLSSAPQVGILLRLLELFPEGLLIRLHLISQGDHLSRLFDVLFVAVLLLQHLLLELLLLDEHHLLLVLLLLPLRLHEVLTTELEHASGTAAGIIVALANRLCIADPTRVIEIEGVALLFAKMRAAELAALLLKLIEGLLLSRLV
mmetsp:Transcript_50737/g.94841  ORF Transcript_50737/g.94841 Transcript_50737/m.94841 type:complete len:211 (+) Transcript_50737:320-952(+)